MLRNIFKKVANRYGNDAMSIMFDYGDDIAQRGADSFLGKLTSRNIKLPDPLLIAHSLDESSLRHNIKEYGGKLINPSIQTTKFGEYMPSLRDYGDAVLLGDKHMINPSQSPVDIYRRDAWTGRHPRIDETSGGGKVISGTDIAPDVSTLSGHMNSIGDDFRNRGAQEGSISAITSKYNEQYKYLTDLLLNEDNLAHQVDVARIYKENYDKLDDLMMGRSGVIYGWQTPAFNTEKGQEILSSILKDLDAYHSGQRTGISDIDQIGDLYTSMKNAPHYYNEIKYNKPLDIGRFNKAYLPVRGELGSGKTYFDKELYDYLTGENVEVRPYYAGTFGTWGRPDASKHIENTVNNGAGLLKGAGVDHQIYHDLGKSNRFQVPYLLGGAGALPILGSLLSGSSDNNQV